MRSLWVASSAAWPHFISTAPKIAYAYVDDYLKLRPDIACAGTLQQIADRRRFPLERLQSAVREGGLLGDRWVLFGPCRVYFTTTEGGAAIDQSLRVLDAAEVPIAGLFAAVQNELGGQILWGTDCTLAGP